MPVPAWGTLVTTPQNESFAASLPLFLLYTPAPRGFNANVTDGVGLFPCGIFIYLFMPYWKGHLSSVLFKLLSTGLGDLVIDFPLERAQSPVKILAN